MEFNTLSLLIYSVNQLEGWIEEELYGRIKEVLPIPCVDLIIIQEGKILVMLRNNEPGKDLWFAPGGRVLRGEILDEAVYRVLLKETGLKPLSISQVGTMVHKWPEVQTITTYYRVDVEDEVVSMNEEHRAYRWITGVPDELHPYLIEMISNTLERSA